jgi:hypothetical protein
MGFIANWKAKRAYKNAMAVYDLEITDWQSDIEIFQKARDAFVLAAKGEDVVVNQTIQKYGEVGDVILTTNRVLFNGMFNTKEWLFSKWNGAAVSADETDYIFNVSNRQKTSGVLFGARDGREFNRFLSCALIAAEYGIDRVIKEIDKNLKELEEDKPAIPPLALEA